MSEREGGARERVWSERERESERGQFMAVFFLFLGLVSKRIAVVEKKEEKIKVGETEEWVRFIPM